MKLLFLLALFAVALSELLENKDGAVLALNKESLISIIKGNELVMVKFYAPWCDHCKALEPEFIAAAKKIKDLNLNILLVKVDIEKEVELANELKIEGIPTLKLFRNGRAVDYQGPRTAQAIVDWLKQKAKISVKQINNVAEAKKFEASHDVFVLGLFSDLRSKAAEEYFAAAFNMNDTSLAISENPAVFEEYGVSADTVLVIKKSKESPNAVFTGPMKHEAITKFVHIESVPLVVEFNQRNAEKIFNGPVKTHLVLLGRVFQVKKIVEEASEAAKQFKGRIMFVSIDADDEQSQLLLRFLSIKKSDMPVMRIISMENKEALKYKPQNSKITNKSIKTFAQSFLEGKLKPYYPSEELPANWDKKPVKVLVSKNFDSVVFDKNKDVLVMFHVPWCEHCEKLAAIFDKLAKKYENRRSLVIAKIDVSANELEHTKIKRYPTIKLYTKGDNEVEDYENEPSLNNLIDFLEENYVFDDIEMLNDRSDKIEL